MKVLQVSSLSFWQRKEQGYVIHWVRHPDEGSVFDRKTRHFRNRLPGFMLLWLMRLINYDGLLFYNGDQFVGHAFFQRHEKELRMFSIFVDEKLRNHGYAKLITAMLLRHARSNGMKSVKLGNGNDRTVCHLWQLAVGNKLTLDFAIEPGIEPWTINID